MPPRASPPSSAEV